MSELERLRQLAADHWEYWEQKMSLDGLNSDETPLMLGCLPYGREFVERIEREKNCGYHEFPKNGSYDGERDLWRRNCLHCGMVKWENAEGVEVDY